ncbi:MAG: hypothetical protein ACREX0_11060, partial [Noviherbaspirillum sp.]
MKFRLVAGTAETHAQAQVQFAAANLDLQACRRRLISEGNMMKLPVFPIFAVLLAMLSGCAAIMPSPVNVGDTETEVIAKRGQPTHQYQDGKDRLLEYALGPWGQKTYMARLAPDGKVISFEQVLTTQKFASIKVDVANKTDVLHTIGAPSDTSYL